MLEFEVSMSEWIKSHKPKWFVSPSIQCNVYYIDLTEIYLIPGGEDDHLRVVQMWGPTRVFIQEFSLAAGIIWKRKSLAVGVNLEEKSLDTGAILLNVPTCGHEFWIFQISVRKMGALNNLWLEMLSWKQNFSSPG